MNLLLVPPTFDDLPRLLRAWRLWVLGALLGGLIGLLVYNLFPPQYRARATVLVDFNVEQSWPDLPDREVFYFLDREARQLVELAWADATLQPVAAQTGVDMTTLRAGMLTLSQPADGGWHFYADSSDPDLAARVASLWAQSFVATVLSRNEFTPYLTLTLTQIEHLPVRRAVPPGTYALAGAGLLTASLALAVLFHPRPAAS